MKYLFFLSAFLMSFFVEGQEKDIATLQTDLDSAYVTMSLNWRYSKGNDLSWKEFDYDDSGWKTFSNWQLAMLDSVDHIEENEIFWFRKYISSGTQYDSVMFQLFQRGAAEIYLNGDKILEVGKIGTEPEGIPYQGNYSIVSLDSGKQYVIAIRYQYIHTNRFFPERNSPNLFLRMGSNSYAKSDGYTLKVVRSDIEDFKPIIFMILGTVTFLTLLFLGIWIYTRERENLYLSLLNLSIVLSGFASIETLYNGQRVELSTLNNLFGAAAFVLILLLAFELLERKKDLWLKIVVFASIIPVILGYFDIAEIPRTIYSLLILISIYRACYLQRSSHKTQSRIIATLTSIFLIPPILGGIGTILGIESGGLDTLSQFTGLAIPLGFGAYVVGTLGKRTKKLKKNLAEVERLSKEREEILASQNEKLEKQVAQRTKDLKESLENLKSTQAQLIQSEKMASLGELTAGIAHEIQNPLNFVNNFSEVSGELVDEINEEIEKGDLEEVKFIAKDLKENLSKINHHGKRAGDIVRGMLEHSRKSDGERKEIDLNALADEYLSLSYHGLRAKDKNFQSDFKTDFDSQIPKLEVNASDISRVFLNLINNAFYEVDKKAKANQKASFKPKVVLKSKLIEMDGHPTGVEFSVVDNADGIPTKVKDKIFQPFFTTKPTGQGTGLGLSLSYDIIKAHGGDLRVKSKEGEGTEMIIYLPIVIQD